MHHFQLRLSVPELVHVASAYELGQTGKCSSLVWTANAQLKIKLL